MFCSGLYVLDIWHSFTRLFLIRSLESEKSKLLTMTWRICGLVYG